MGEPHHTDRGYPILQELRKIIRQIGFHSKALSRESGLTLPQLLCLKAIQESSQQPVLLVDISRQVQLSPATVSGILDRLERSELIQRERLQKDRRKVGLSVTQLGQKKLEDAPTPLQEQFLKRLQSLPKAEHEQLLQSLKTIVSMMQAEAVDSSPLLISEDQVN